MAITLNKLYPGKLSHDFLGSLIKKYTTTGHQIVCGAQVGEDATVVEFDDTYLVLKTDPVTFTTDHIGHYAVHVNANDIACMGATPKWFLATILLPERTTRQTAEAIFSQISKTCKREKIAYCGGHTEVTPGIEQAIVVGQMVGKANKEHLKLKQHIKIGDHILLIQSAPVEAISILARHKEAVLQEQFSREFVKTCQNFLFLPGISVREYAQLAQKSAEVHAMHDPTEGGVATAVHEMANAANCGAIIDRDNVPLLTEGKLVCEFFDIDPLGCIASGSLLVAAPYKSVEPILKACDAKNIPAGDIGKFVEKDKGLVLTQGDAQKRLPLFAQDELLKIL
jgi:hydrogenase maturation factor